MNTTGQTLIICIKDIQKITGKSIGSAKTLHAAIKKKYNKPRSGFVTIDEFCEYTGFKPERVWYKLK